MFPIRAVAVCAIAAWAFLGIAHAGQAPLKVFIIAGDENVLGQGEISRQDKDGREVAGTLVDVVSKQARFAFLRGEGGKWITRDDVILYDGHPMYNDTVSMGAPLQVGDRGYGEMPARSMMGPELMFGHVLGDALEERVLLIRFAIHGLSSRPGSRSLARDYRSPSSWGGAAPSGNWDVIHFNFGVWDTARRSDTSDAFGGRDKNAPITTPIDVYEENLRTLVAKMKKTGATLIWGSTTPCHPDTPGCFPEDPINYNKVAEKVMKENGVIINDLYAECIKQGFPKKPDVHSVGDMGPATLAVVEKALKERETTSKPLPRVLFIGDSIRKFYIRYVMKALEGKADVYQNPGNGEHTGTGLKMIDEWLALDTYVFSGQEYLELTKCVKAVFDNPGRFAPGYGGEKLQLAGLVWFQGIDDGKSSEKAELYEQNLACLIRDLRKDLDEPRLPVVVAANHYGKVEAGQPGKTVHSAQMAVGDPAKYPEFAGNVVSVDTTPFFRDSKQSPGALERKKQQPLFLDDRYNNNAESFLLVGEAVGNAMIKLLGEHR